jgi:hypothetical protein
MHLQSYRSAGTTNQLSKYNTLSYFISYIVSIGQEKIDRGCFPGKIVTIYWATRLSEPSQHQKLNLYYSLLSHTYRPCEIEVVDTRKCSQVLASTRKSYSQVTRKSHASDSQILASPDLGANTRK